MNENTILPDDPRLTAYALGELEGEELAMVEEAVRGDPALRSTVDAIRATARSIETVLAAEAADDEQTADGRGQRSEVGGQRSEVGGQRAEISQPGTRNPEPGTLSSELLTVKSRYKEPVVSTTAMDAAAKKTGQRGELLRFPSLYFVIGGLAAACFAVMVVLYEPQPRVLSEQKRYVEVPLVPSPTASGSETQAPIGPGLTEGITVVTLSDAATTFHFDTRLDKPEAGKLTPPVMRLAESAPGITWDGGSAAPRVIASRVSRQSPGARIFLTGGTTQTEPDSIKDSQFVRVPRTYASGGPATTFGFDPFGLQLPKFEGTFGDLASNFGGTGGGRAFGTTRGFNGFAGAPLVGPFFSVRQPTPRTYYYPPDKGFVFRAVPYGSKPLDEKFVFRAVPYGSPDWLAPFHSQPWIKPAAPIIRSQSFNTEDYAQIRDNDFAAVAVEPLSTFALDVDTASYSNLRRFLERGQRPPRDAVRIEELVNYFPYRYTPPASTDAPFAASLEVAAAPWNPQHRLVRIGLKAREISEAARPAANLVFLVDVSGSMAKPAKLPLVQESLRLLVGRLRADDHVAIVTYSTQATLALPATPVARGSEILAAIDGLAAHGSTNGAMGLQLAYDIAKANVVMGGVNRVILCTDGDFNVGVTQRGDLVRLIEDKAKSGVFLTVLGFGTGNLKDATLEQLADKGNGIYGYVDSAVEAKRLLVEQAGATLVTVAKDVKVQVEFNPAVAGAYRLIGYENRLLRKQDFADDRVDAGEIGAGHTVTALYEVVPVGATAALNLASTEPLRYQRAEGGWRRAENGRQTADGGRRTTEGGRQTAEVGGQKSEVRDQWSEVRQPGTRNSEPGTQDLQPGTRNSELGTGNPEPGTLSAELLTVKVRYKAPDGSVSQRLEFPLTDRGTTWAEASEDFKFAASVASFGMILRESPYKGTATLASVAEWARQGLGSDAGGQRNEFLGLVSRAQTMVQ